MQDLPEEIEVCYACGSGMNVAAVGPFSNVACPICGEHNRVKRVLGPYVLERRHSLGGMSTIFVARDQTLNREVAVKVLSEQWCTDEKRISAFVEEARLTASFSHPNVVRVFRTGWAYGRFYIAMELVAGAHLEHWIRQRGKIPELETLTMAIQVTQGLKAAQMAGLIHRDMKPGNILLDEQGNAKIVDFGLALVTQGGAATATELWATPYYVPPEAVEGKEETFRSDMYAFGATLYHALAGVPPCAEDSMATDKLREAKKHIKLLQREAPDISNATCRIVNRAMSYEPENRFDSYDEMISLLEDAKRRLIAGEGDYGGPKRGFPVGIFTAIILLGALGGGGWWWVHLHPVVIHKKPSVVSSTRNVGASELPGGPSVDTQLYQKAKLALFSEDHGEAGKLFVSLRDDGKVPEPTATWCGAEAALAAGLSGDYALARRQAVLTVRHAQYVDVTDPAVKDSLLPLLQKYDKLQIISASGVAASLQSNAELLIALLAGIKNWEQGSLEDAEPFFNAVAQARINGADDWTVFYQKAAAHYVADHALLTDPVFNDYPSTAAACKESIETLESFLPKLQTQGRARFNIRAWQLDLAKHAKRLKVQEDKAEKEKAAPVASSEDTPLTIVAKVSGFGSSYDFEQAENYLKAQPSSSLTTSLLTVVSSSRKLMEQLTDDLKKEAAVFPIELRSGTRISRLAADEKGALSGTDEKGNTIKVFWSDISADTVIALHRNAVKSLQDDAEVTRRHTNAIFFDWLAGNRTRAQNAADRFSLAYPDFRSRWQDFISTLP